LPTPSPRRRLPAAQRRELILRAAAAVIAERGHHGAGMDEIAGRAGVSAPVLYDHFASKVALHVALLERIREELRTLWVEHLAGDEPADVRVPRALAAWAAYVEGHRDGITVYFRESQGPPEVEAKQREIVAQGRRALAGILGDGPAAEATGGTADPIALEMATEIIRAGLAGLALWWGEHPEVPRARVVQAAINTVWIGVDRVRRGEGATLADSPGTSDSGAGT
jgi:AcrR family transcriptional regulator